MNGHVREIRHMYQFAVPTAENFFESQYFMITVGDVDWVCLVLDRKVWKAPLNMIMCLHVVEAAMYVANGATVTGIFEEKFSVTLNFAAK
jgi:hypothetical protein